MKIKCLIVDDEPLGRNVIINHLKNFSDFEIIGTCNDAMEAFQFIKKESVDVMFLDINMPEMSGIEFIKGLDKKPLTVITTAYREYAVESFELDVVDYLVKPISLQRFMKSADKILDHFKLISGSTAQESNDHIFIKVDKKIVKILLQDILYIESLKDYVRVVTPLESLITHHNLRSITKLLPEEMFLRIHRSYTVAIDKIKSLEGNNIEIEGKSLPIGRNYQKKIKKRIGADKI
ncbi:LytR/AlgR family response regulator transcription factor [Fulvivirga ligni]|uniref:LytR/AlgR family response regulator transcription factor n=1 Tax=Fulvivirga ligni TaxID=2904246 RepID=UPI001F431ACD|nr:LytTR family DNA-binding domain-containing protein [Fulvivirga ligni]UII22881.1 LytTR family DNA-binding domain-containing protein [Fulvivirga ligni]